MLIGNIHLESATSVSEYKLLLSFGKRCNLSMKRSLLPPAVSAQNIVSLGEEAASHQRDGALRAGETLAVPLTLFKGDVLSPGQTGNGLGAAHTLLCIQVAEAFQAVRVVLPGGEALA